MISGLNTGRRDRSKGVAGLIDDLLVREAKNGISQRFDISLTVVIGLLAVKVDRAVHVDDRLCLVAKEVRHNRCVRDRMLASELQVAEPTITQALPQHILGPCLTLAQVACDVNHRL